MKTYTVEDVVAEKPCEDYPEPRVRELLGEREGLTAREIGELPIPAWDRLWVLIYVVLGDRDRRLLAVRCARETLGRLENPDPRSVAAVDVAERFADGEASAAELAAARAAAVNAACDAALDAANAVWAAYAAAWDAASAANAAWDAACAASAAARDAASERYLGWAIELAEAREQKGGTEK